MRSLCHDEPLTHGVVRAIDPARRVIRRWLEPDRQAIFHLGTRGDDFELQGAHDADDPVRADERSQHACNALLGEIERSEEHTSELQSLMRISYAVFCLKTKKLNKINHK